MSVISLQGEPGCSQTGGDDGGERGGDGRQVVSTGGGGGGMTAAAGMIQSRSGAAEKEEEGEEEVWEVEEAGVIVHDPLSSSLVRFILSGWFILKSLHRGCSSSTNILSVLRS